MNKVIILFITVIALSSCRKKNIVLENNISFDQEINISYGNDPEQKMDLYTPSSRNKDNTVFIIIHGGGWRAGKKSDLTFFVLSMMKQFPTNVFANIEYRLASEARYGIPSQTQDIQKAIGFLSAQLPKDSRYVLLGNSAGGHLSMLYAYKFDKDKKVKAVVNIVGPSDLSDPNFKTYSDYRFVENRLVDPSSIPAGLSKTDFASPTQWLSQDSPPTISFYGNNDQVIPLSQKRILDSALNKNKVYHRSYEFSGGHLDWNNEKNAPFVINSIYEFLKH